jgi:hypothetical protein
VHPEACRSGDTDGEVCILHAGIIEENRQKAKKLHEKKTKNQVEYREPEPISSWSIFHEIDSDDMGEYEGCDRRPDEMRWIHIDPHERRRCCRSVDIGDIRIHGMMGL